MDTAKSLDESKIIAALIRDVSNAHGLVFNTRACRLTISKVERRLREEGIGFLTKTLPKLGKAFDKAISGGTPLSAAKLGFKPQPGSELPRFLGEFFSRVLSKQGSLLLEPCAKSVKVIRQITYLFYKYELSYTDEQEQQVVSAFKSAESDLSNLGTSFKNLEADLALCYTTRRGRNKTLTRTEVAREARILLHQLFQKADWEGNSLFDPKNILPRHGPGAVATKQKRSGKYRWSNVSAKITALYPLDDFFFVNQEHVCDRLDTIQSITDMDLPARVVLVPKDSRGPRLISCEPVDKQWIQQGIAEAVVQLVERHPLTRENVRFTDQEPNRGAALAGSRNGRYCTLDLKEASDRVHLDLVRLLFPSFLTECLEASRSSSTELPDGSVLPLLKFAPMGSALCFPVMALTIWALLTAMAPDAYTRERIYVYGDDVIVPTAFAGNAIEQLESFGLQVNRDKSCTGGLFRESCGMDAFNGVNVTPVRLRTVWSSLRSPDVFSSWVAYANSFYDARCYQTYELIVGALKAVYGPIPSEDMHLHCPCLRDASGDAHLLAKRWNRTLHKVQYRVLDLKAPAVVEVSDGWSMLLRFFSESANRRAGDLPACQHHAIGSPSYEGHQSFSVSTYTDRRASILARRWR